MQNLHIPVAVASTLWRELIAIDATERTLDSAAVMIEDSWAMAAVALAKATLLTEAWLAAAPDRVWPARSLAMMALKEDSAALAAAVAADIIEAIMEVAMVLMVSAAARPLRPETRIIAGRMVIMIS
jgi:hypothetical protein